MYLEFYYFACPIVDKYKENTIIESIKTDLERFFLYHFWERIDNNFNKKNLQANLFIQNTKDYFIPNLIFSIKWNLDNKQTKELLEIFSNNWEENFVLNTDIKIKKKKFLNLDNNIEEFLKKTKDNFESFLKYYEKHNIIDENNPQYRKFKKTYNLFLYLNYFLLKNYNSIIKEKKELRNIGDRVQEYTSHIKLLDKRLEIDKENLEKNIAILSHFLEKIMNILKKIDK